MILPGFNRWLYKYIGKPVFFCFDPEKVHDLVSLFGRFLGSNFLSRSIVRLLYQYRNPKLKQNVLGINFKSPVGLAAGFDKNGRLTDIISEVGFGFEEIGSITGRPCPGNPKPRAWRLKKSKGLLIYYGLPNFGAKVIAQRLMNKKFNFPIFTSIAKTNDSCSVAINDGIADYVSAFREFVTIGDFFVINISCPNAYGGEPFVTPERLDLLLREINKIETKKPIFIKTPANISLSDLDALVAVCKNYRVHGFIVSNLNKNFQDPTIVQTDMPANPKGGISGRPAEILSNERIAHLYKTVGQQYVIIGCGGIFSAEDAYEKICLGASLVELITGMIYEGPQLIGEINKGLVKLLDQDGFSNIAEAIGSKTGGYEKKC